MSEDILTLAPPPADQRLAYGTPTNSAISGCLGKDKKILFRWS